jgi:hypothetical protein
MEESSTVVEEIKKQTSIKQDMDEARLVLQATRRMMGEPSPSPGPSSAASPKTTPFSRFFKRTSTNQSLTSIGESDMEDLRANLRESPSPSPAIVTVNASPFSRGTESSQPTPAWSQPTERRSFKDRKKFQLQELVA